MAESSEPNKKSPVAPVTPLPKKAPFVGLPPKLFPNNNSSLNKFGSKGRSGGGKPAILKHSRSR